MGIIEKLVNDVTLPKFVKIKQNFSRPRIEDVADEVRKIVESSGLLNKIKPRQTIAITGGSRGVANIDLILKTVVDMVKEVDGEPFIIPAMGSHGGATAEGQKEVLEGMGISEETMGVSIKSSMEVAQIGETDNGLPVFIDKFANEADGIIVVNRIKPHVAFRGKYESGLMKMITIGLGKQYGASICHDQGFGKMAENIPAFGTKVIAAKNIIMALGVLENAYDETCKIVALSKNEIETKEPALLEEAKANLPAICYDHLDVLIIDEIGKDITGTGLDTNIVGRYHTPYASGGPDITKMVVLDLTEKSHGNGNGIGIVDFTTQRFMDKMILEQTYPNSLTSTVQESIKIPMIIKNDRLAIKAAIKTCNILDKKQARIVRIKNTLKLENIYISENLIEEAKNDNRLEILGEAEYLKFDEQGNLF